MKNKIHRVKDSDLWETPDCLFKSLNSLFNFDIDLCANKHNKKISTFSNDIFTLESIKAFNSAFMNPPYSNMAPFVRKAWELAKDCQVVCLVPSSIKSCKYMDFLDDMEGTTTFRMWTRGVIWLDLSRRTKFIHPNKISDRPTFGCSLLILNNPGDK